jgi:cardiolipin synthase (CMP-forming)
VSPTRRERAVPAPVICRSGVRACCGIDIRPPWHKLSLGMTTANKVTIVRILLVPYFIAQVLYYIGDQEEIHRLQAILSFAVAAISDGIDGYIARRYHQRSELGAILDPLADKLLLVSGTVLLSLDHGPCLERIPLWFVTTIVSRDVLLVIGVAVIHYTCGKIVVRPRILGKIATVLQMATLLWALLKWNSQWLLVGSAAAAMCTGISGLWYVLDGMKQLSASPTSSALPPAEDHAKK